MLCSVRRCFLPAPVGLKLENVLRLTFGQFAGHILQPEGLTRGQVEDLEFHALFDEDCDTTVLALRTE